MNVQTVNTQFEKVYPLFYIKFKTGDTTSEKAKIYDDNKYAIHAPAELPQMVVMHFKHKLAILPDLEHVQELPKILLGANAAHLFPEEIAAPKDLKEKYPQLRYFRSRLTKKIMTFAGIGQHSVVCSKKATSSMLEKYANQE